MGTCSRRRRWQPQQERHHHPLIVLLLLLALLFTCGSAFWAAPSMPSPSQKLQLSAAARSGGGSNSGTKGSPKGGGGGGGGKAAAAAKGKGGGGPKPTNNNKKAAGPKVLGKDWAWPVSDKTPLPMLDTLYPPLSPKQLLDWERDGHTITRGLCSPAEIADYTKVIRAAFEREKLQAYRQKIRVMLGQEAYDDCQTLEECEEVMEEYIDQDMVPFLQTFNAWRRYQDVRRLALAPRFAQVAAKLLNVPRVRLYQDSTFLKRCGDGPTLWHSDLNMAPFHCNEAVTMWMPMTDILPEEEGGTGLTFASRSHRDFALNYWDDPHAGNDLSGRYSLQSYGAMVPGDASWHHGWLLHSSGHNDGDDRVAFTLCFVADGVPLLSEDAKHRPDDEDGESYADWLHDFKPGEQVKDHVYLPLVWDEATMGGGKGKTQK